MSSFLQSQRDFAGERPCLVRLLLASSKCVLTLPEIRISPLETTDIKSRYLSGRQQVSVDGMILIDGLPFGKPALRKIGRPKIHIPPRKRSRLTVEQEDVERILDNQSNNSVSLADADMDDESLLLLNGGAADVTSSHVKPPPKKKSKTSKKVQFALPPLPESDEDDESDYEDFHPEKHDLATVEESQESDSEDDDSYNEESLEEASDESSESSSASSPSSSDTNSSEADSEDDPLLKTKSVMNPTAEPRRTQISQNAKTHQSKPLSVSNPEKVTSQLTKAVSRTQRLLAHRQLIPWQTPTPPGMGLARTKRRNRRLKAGRLLRKLRQHDLLGPESTLREGLSGLAGPRKSDKSMDR